LGLGGATAELFAEFFAEFEPQIALKTLVDASRQCTKLALLDKALAERE
jgi:hypothetical protein